MKFNSSLHVKRVFKFEVDIFVHTNWITFQIDLQCSLYLHCLCHFVDFISVMYEVELLNFVEHGGVDDIELLSEVNI